MESQVIKDYKIRFFSTHILLSTRKWWTPWKNLTWIRSQHYEKVVSLLINTGPWLLCLEFGVFSTHCWDTGPVLCGCPSLGITYVAACPMHSPQLTQQCWETLASVLTLLWWMGCCRIQHLDVGWWEPTACAVAVLKLQGFLVWICSVKLIVYPNCMKNAISACLLLYEAINFLRGFY